MEYNNALARFEYAKGTILEHDNVQIAEGVLPNCAAVRAVEHERERSNALVLRERAQPVAQPALPVPGHSLAGVPEFAVPADPAAMTTPDSAAPAESVPAPAPATPAGGPTAALPEAPTANPVFVSASDPLPAVSTDVRPAGGPDRAAGPAPVQEAGLQMPNESPALMSRPDPEDVFASLDYASVCLPGIEGMRFRLWLHERQMALQGPPDGK